MGFQTEKLLEVLGKRNLAAERMQHTSDMASELFENLWDVRDPRRDDRTFAFVYTGKPSPYINFDISDTPANKERTRRLTFSERRKLREVAEELGIKFVGTYSPSRFSDLPYSPIVTGLKRGWEGRNTPVNYSAILSSYVKSKLHKYWDVVNSTVLNSPTWLTARTARYLIHV